MQPDFGVITINHRGFKKLLREHPNKHNFASPPDRCVSDNWRTEEVLSAEHQRRRHGEESRARASPPLTFSWGSGKFEGNITCV